MELPSYFLKFLSEIRPTDSQRDDAKTGHTTLRDRLKKYEGISDIIISTFLQGSYRRSTAIRPNNGTRSDVDVIVVTNLNRDDYPDPNKAMDLFVPFLNEYYKGKYQKNGRSFGIELSYVDLDLVITSAPSEAQKNLLRTEAVTTLKSLDESDDWRLVKSWIPPECRTDAISEEIRKEQEWKSEPLYIPDRNVGEWKRTNPLEQIKWCFGKNARCNKHFINVVKAIKWWQRTNFPDDKPKGYPLEHLIGYYCPDNIQSVAVGVTMTLEGIKNGTSLNAFTKTTPELFDHGVPEHNVMSRITGEEYSNFYNHLSKAAEIARSALDADTPKESTTKWRELFGNKFPPSDNDDKQKDFDPKGPFVRSTMGSTGDLTPRKYGKFCEE